MDLAATARRHLLWSTPLEQALRRDANNFDLIRLCAALAVIYGHAFPITQDTGSRDVLMVLTGNAYPTATMAVKMFFFLSGLLVTNSLLEKRSAVHYVMARLFRIWPGLLLVLCGCAFVIGPLVTSLDLRAYFSDPNTWLYVKRQALIQSWGTQAAGYYNLPGVFEQNPYPRIVNASLWSLAVEVYAYLLLLAVFLVGLLWRRIALVLLGLVLLDALLPTRILFPFLPKDQDDFAALPFCFGAGALMALYKERVRVSLAMPLGFALLVYLFLRTEYEKYFFFMMIFSWALLVAAHPLTIRWRPSSDLSYGVFLWGFPIQQVLAMHFASKGAAFNQIFGALAAVAMAWISWHLVEKRAMSYGRRLADRITGTQRSGSEASVGRTMPVGARQPG